MCADLLFLYNKRENHFWHTQLIFRRKPKNLTVFFIIKPNLFLDTSFASIETTVNGRKKKTNKQQHVQSHDWLASTHSIYVVDFIYYFTSKKIRTLVALTHLLNVYAMILLCVLVVKKFNGFPWKCYCFYDAEHHFHSLIKLHFQIGKLWLKVLINAIILLSIETMLRHVS